MIIHTTMLVVERVEHQALDGRLEDLQHSGSTQVVTAQGVEQDPWLENSYRDEGNFLRNYQ